MISSCSSHLYRVYKVFIKVCLIFIIAYLDEFKPTCSFTGGDIWKSSLFLNMQSDYEVIMN